MTNYVPIPGMQIPQAGQMTNYPAIPSVQPLVQHNPYYVIYQAEIGL